MAVEIGELVKSVRKAKGLGRGELVRRMGYRNLNRGCRHLLAVESGEMPDREFFDKLVSALEIDPEQARAATKALADRRAAEYERWLDEPIQMHLVIRASPGFLMSESLSDCADREAAMEYAASRARFFKAKTWLVFSRRESVYFDEEGNARPSSKPADAPYMQLKGKRFLFQFAK